MSDYSYPEELIKKTEKRIRAQLDGNGTKQENVKITVKRQDIGIFTARTSYDIDYAVNTKTASGKVVEGKLVTQGQLQSEITNSIEALKSDKTINDTMVEIIKKLPAQGFGAHKQKLQIPQTKQSSFVYAIKY